MVQTGAAGAVGAGEAVAEVDPFGVDAELDQRLVVGGDVLLVGIVKSPQDGVTVTLHTLLAEARPYVLVGHSAGGPLVRGNVARNIQGCPGTIQP